MAKIVVADDDADIRDLVVFKLKQSGHEVVALGDGASAVAACRERSPDLAILGRDPADRPRPGDRHRAGLSVGADDYLVKPVSPRELAARVAEVLQRSGA